MGIWQWLDELVSRRIWGAEPDAAKGPRALLIRWLRLFYLVTRDQLDGQLSLRAMSMVYTSILSLVPLLAVTFSVLKAFGVHNQIEPFLGTLLVPLGAEADQITRRVIGFVDNIKVGVLGSVGLALLIYFVVSLIQKIETNLNFIWKIRRSRSLGQRFSEYISVILVGPVLFFAALGLTASVSSTALVQTLLATEVIGGAVRMLGRLIPYLLVCGAFTFIYAFIPNTRVRLGSALAGGIVAGLLWQTVGWLFASFVVTSAKYAAIYSGFAVLVLFMIWLYVGWYILLLGAQIAYYHQHPQASRVRIDEHQLAGSLRERLALLIMLLVGYNHYHDRRAWTAEALAAHLGLSMEPIEAVTDDLLKGGFVVATGDDPPAYVPARDIETIGLKDLLDGIRGARLRSAQLEDLMQIVPGLARTLRSVDEAIASVLDEQSVKTLVLGETSLQAQAAAPATAKERRRSA